MLNLSVLFAAFALLQAPAPSAESLVAGVGRLAAAADNDARFEVLAAMLRERDLPFAVEPFAIDRPGAGEPRRTGRNIVVTIGDGRGEIVVGAHYDASRLPDGTLSRGAVDNGASSVMLVHLAESLRSAALPVRVRVVWFDGEELGLLGSAHYVATHGADAIRAMVNFDINAYGETVLYSAPDGGGPPWRRAVLETCAAEAVDCVRLTRLPASDDRPFAAAGIPALSLARLTALEAHQIWLMLEGGAAAGLEKGTVPAILRTIHTAADVIDKVDGDAMARVHQFALGLIRRLAAMAPPGAARRDAAADAGAEVAVRRGRVER